MKTCTRHAQRVSGVKMLYRHVHRVPGILSGRRLRLQVSIASKERGGLEVSEQSVPISAFSPLEDLETLHGCNSLYM